MKKRHCSRLSRDIFSIDLFAIFIALKRSKVMFSQVCVYSHGVSISGPMSFPGVSLVPSPFKGVMGISGTRSLLGTGYPGVGWVSLVPGPFWGLGIQEWGGYLWYQVPSGDWVSRSGVGIRGRGEYSSPRGGYVGMSRRWVITPPLSGHMEYYEIWSTSGRYVSYWNAFLS